MIARARETALALLSRRAYTERALARALVARGIGEAAAAAAAAELSAKGWVDEESEALERAFDEKARRLPAGLTPEARSKKLFDHLVRRGFAPAAVIEALHRKGEVNDDDYPGVDV